MALTYTPKSVDHTACPSFKLEDVYGKVHSRDDFKDKIGLCVMFICNHCPYVKAVEDRLLNLARKFSDVQFLGICSNDPSEHPEDAPGELKKRAIQKDYPFPYLIDQNQEVAIAFGAVCTPDIFLYDRERKLFYRGRVDDSWRNPAAVTREELKNALELLTAAKPPPQDVFPSMGCSIKWRSS